MKLRHILPALALALMLSACGGAANTAAPYNQAESVAVAPAAPPAQGGSALDSDAAKSNSPGSAADQAQPQIDRLVIKTAKLSLQVESVRDAETAVRAKVQSLGGYVITSESSGYDAATTTQISFRVPAQRFDEALAGVQGLAKRVTGRSISGDDVTEEFVDLQSRMRNLEATRDRLQSFLDKASTVDEALNVNQSLSDIQGQIEQAKGRMQFLQQNAALSTISVTLSPVAVEPPLVQEDGWDPVTVARRAFRSLIELGQGLAEVAIVLLVWTPAWLPIVLLVWWLRRRFFKRARPATPDAAA